MDEQVNIPALYMVWFSCAFWISERVLNMHVLQRRDEASGWNQFRMKECLEKATTVKLYKIVP